jgi:3-oxoacyl-[acyl-carrier-protein] synthase II
MFFKTMNHSCASNTAQALGIRGRVVSPSVACATGTLAIGLAYENILYGVANIMICGGTDEHHVLATAVFDIMSAASCNYNDNPHQTPRPFDVDRDGVVCAEGAGIVILEELEHARERGANILGEIIGFATFSSPGDIANSDSETMADCMDCALSQAGIGAEDVGYVSAHATATTQGDIAEARAICKAVGDKVPVSSLKGHLGHTMAASGALELIASLEMMHNGVLIPTRNLVTVDPDCDVVNLILTKEDITGNVVLKNSFALGGINATILIRRNIHD